MVVPTMVSLSETEDESITTMESLIDSVETPSWSSNAQMASLTNTRTTLTLAEIPVANATLDNVRGSLPRVAQLTTTPQRTEVKFTLRGIAAHA